MYIDLHQHPELGFMEVRTAEIITKEFKALGYEVVNGIGKTGVAAILKNGNGPTVMYRADMDCNGVKETTGLPYASTRTMKKADGTESPVMHACGHDAHITWMLGVARIMTAMKSNWKGTLVFVAQPAEELLMGAQAMVDDSMYAKGVPVPDFLFGMHTDSALPLGTIDNGLGIRSAGSDQLDVTFHGVGGHGSEPEFTKDPVVMAANAVMQYQTIISRNIAALNAAVITIGSIQAGSDNNVIPSSALVKVNLRWFNEETRSTLLDGIKRINEGIAVANGLSKEQYPTIKMKGNAYPLDNDTVLTTKINNALKPAYSSIITNRKVSMGSEDFQHLVRSYPKTKCNYLQIGITNPEEYAKFKSEGKDVPYFHHTGGFRVDLRAIPVGTEIGAIALLEVFRKTVN
ncbi:MAG: amidohydrolase [Chitinophagaceae bacterium]|nr:MAG: amidohydrolase [Chitinophagaceae bacterium]